MRYNKITGRINLVLTLRGSGEKETAMSLLNMILGSMTSQTSVDSLAGKTGLDKKKIASLLAIALPLLMKSMTQNASSQQGASSLLGALAQHTNPNRKSTAQQISEADAGDGAKIVNHILGKDTDKIIGQMAGQTDLTPDQVSTVLAQMAPAMMSGVSEATDQAKKEKAKASSSGIDLSDGFDMKDVMGIIGATSKGKGKGGSDLLSMLLKASK